MKMSAPIRERLHALADNGYRGTALAMDSDAELVAVLDVQAERIRYLASIRSEAMPAELAGVLTLPTLRFGDPQPDPLTALNAAIDAARDIGLEIDVDRTEITLQ